MITSIIKTLRPEQWYKNLLLFVGIIFSMNLLNLKMWFAVIPAFVIFCMLSGSEYIVNDILDMKKDREHPIKRKRAIASGELKASHALLFAIMLIISAGVGAYLINIPFLIISIVYLLLILSYSLFLKQLIIVDILVIAIGFVIRAVAGCLAIVVFISPWLIICTLLLALFLALGKRRHELILLGEEAKVHRKILEDYSTEMLEQMISITSGALIISYSLYTFLADNIYMMLTIPFAIYGLFRYLFLVHAKNFGGETEMIFRDRGMVMCMVLWAVLVVLILCGIPDVVVRVGGGI
ncbi:decaprenyl-phosphate phosphoribosyltransferase [candidate division WOR-3 bacterium]|nr:decaprenyl-phosphate phosphoribosyltransferase [candidate division WOR-3 bacterium]